MGLQGSASFCGSALVAAGMGLLALAAGRCLRFTARRSRPGARGASTCDWGVAAVLMIMVLGASLAALAAHIQTKQVHADLLERSLSVLSGPQPPTLLVFGDAQKSNCQDSVAS